MYGISQTQDFGFFTGKRIQLCIGMHDLIFNFDDGVSVLVTSSIGYSEGGAPILKFVDFRGVISQLVHLLEREVISANAKSDGKTLRIEFAGGIIIELYDDSEQYESLVIKNGAETIVV